MTYKQYLKQPINESLNSAKAKFSGSPEEFEALKLLDPTANKKWKFMDFIVKTGNQPDLKDLLTEFERLANKGIIKNKDINSYDYKSLKKEIKQSSQVTTKRQGKIDVKKDVIKVNNSPLVIIPLTEEASIQYGKGTKWCTAALNNNYFNRYFFNKGITLFYILADKKWAVALYPNGNTECFNEQDESVGIYDIEVNTGIGDSKIKDWNNQIKVQVQKVREKNPLIIFKYVENNDVEGVKRLVQAGADVDKLDGFNETPLYLASLKGHLEIVKLLVNAGADVDKQNNDGNTPLSMASFYGHLETVKLLVNAGADVDKQNNNGHHPLSLASFKGYLETVKLLVNAGADVDKQDIEGNTPLSMASYSGKTEIVKLLKQAGATE